MKNHVNRRRFLRGTIFSGLGLILLPNPRSVLGYPANDRVNVALVGVSGRGGWFVDTMPKISTVVAMCDVNDYRASGAYEKVPQARKFRDFRKMLEEIGNQIDGVVIATPDNTHAVISAAAIRAGKAVFCEKPLTHDVQEARTLQQLAREYKVVTQMGNQGTSSTAFRQATAYLWAGTIGSVREVHAWNTGGGAGPRSSPQGSQPIPEPLDWDLWLGPAADRPYHSEWAQWHTWRDFATGQLGNWASHTVNVVFKGLQIDTLWDMKDSDLKQRILRLEAEVSSLCMTTFPRSETIRYDIPARGTMPRLRMNWYNGAGRAPGPRDQIEEQLGYKLDWGDAGQKKWDDHAGCLLIGTLGKIHSNGHNTVYRLLPEDTFKDVQPPQTFPRSPGHEQEWLAAIKGGPAAMSHFDYSGKLAEFVLLGNVATLVEGPIEYDPVEGKIINNPQANALLQREYRKGWSL